MKLAQQLTGRTLSIGGSAPQLRNNFLSTYIDWITKSTIAPATGIGSYRERYYVNGVTQAYDIFFSEHRDRRFRTLSGEYPYTRLSVPRWALLSDEEGLAPGDALIMSAPFYAHGNVPRNWLKLLDQCRDLSIPVMIDAAYYGTGYGVSFEYNHPAVDMVAFSLSKPFGLQSWRVGMMLTNRKLPYLEEIQVAANYFNHVGAYVGLQYLNTFTADYMPLKYQAKHRLVAYQLGLLPSDCLMLALVRDEDQRFDEILGDDRFPEDPRPLGQLRRVCISSYISNPEWWPKRVVRSTLNGAFKALRPSTAS